MSASSYDQYVFGTQAATSPGSRLESKPPVDDDRSSVSAPWLSTRLTEVPAGSELHSLCSRVAEALPDPTSTAVVLTRGRELAQPGHEIEAKVATSAPAVTAVLRVEWLLREGPVRATLQSHRAVVVDRLGPDGRWPRFGRAVLAHHTASAAAVPLPLGADDAAGVLIAFSAAEDAFDPRDLRVLTAFSRVVADAVAREQLGVTQQNVSDLETADLVNQAVGVLMTHHCDEHQALRRLRRISESTGQPLAAAAQLIVDEAQLEARLRFVSHDKGRGSRVR